MSTVGDVVRSRIRDIPDYPKPGIQFKDITPLLLDPEALDAATRALADWARPRDVQLVVAAEARGFILGGALAQLVEGAGGVIAGCGFLVELAFLGGREALAGYEVHALVSYDAE